MSEDGQIEAHVWYSTFKSTVKVFFLTSTDEFDELKT